MDIQGNVKFGQGYWVDRFRPSPTTTTVVSGGGGSDQRNSLTGTIDGNNKVFTLASAPDINNLKVFVNGMLQSSSDDYVLNGNTITFLIAPQVGDTIVSYYGGGASRQIVSGTVDGNNRIFTFPSAPSATSLQLFVNGLLQHEIDDYVLVGNQITLTIAPGVGSNLVAYF